MCRKKSVVCTMCQEEEATVTPCGSFDEISRLRGITHPHQHLNAHYFVFSFHITCAQTAGFEITDLDSMNDEYRHEPMLRIAMRYMRRVPPDYESLFDPVGTDGFLIFTPSLSWDASLRVVLCTDENGRTVQSAKKMTERV